MFRKCTITVCRLYPSVSALPSQLPLGKGGFERMCVNESKTYFNKYFAITIMAMLLHSYNFKKRVIYDAF